LPSIRNDLIAPEFQKIQDKTNYGNGGNAWSLITPSIFSQHGVYEKDVLKPRSQSDIRKIFENIGVDLNSGNVFENAWQIAQQSNPYGEVSVEEFRCALDKLSQNNNENKSKNELLCC
jgi:EF-hand domain-containing family member B